MKEVCVRWLCGLLRRFGEQGRKKTGTFACLIDQSYAIVTDDAESIAVPCDSKKKAKIS